MFELLGAQGLVLLIILAGFGVALFKRDELFPILVTIAFIFAIGLLASFFVSGYFLIPMVICYGLLLAHMARLELKPLRNKIGITLLLCTFGVAVGFLSSHWLALFFGISALMIGISYARARKGVRYKSAPLEVLLWK